MVLVATFKRFHECDLCQIERLALCKQASKLRLQYTQLGMMIKNVWKQQMQLVDLVFRKNTARAQQHIEEATRNRKLWQPPPLCLFPLKRERRRLNINLPKLEEHL